FGYANHFIGFIEADRALTKLAAAVRGMVPSDGLLARIGGDEFVVVLPDAREGTRGARLAHQLLEVVRESLQHLATPDALAAMSTATSPFTASIGVVSFAGRDSLTFENLVREAFERAAFAKRRGRNRVWAQTVVAEHVAAS
ncbi:MAG TPA: diguanylate cyclase, partial [Burkholderiaceae bacterium]